MISYTLHQLQPGRTYIWCKNVVLGKSGFVKKFSKYSDIFQGLYIERMLIPVYLKCSYGCQTPLKFDYYRPPEGGRLYDMKVVSGYAFLRTYYVQKKSTANHAAAICHKH